MVKSELKAEEFIQAYLVCALWSSTGDDEEPLDKEYDTEDLSPEALERAREDCIDFIAAQSSLLMAVDANSEQHGHDFWLTRNGHGAGFWDRGYGDVGDQLSEACKPYGGCDLYVGDDGKLYFF